MKFLAITFLIASLPALAQDSAQYRACDEKAKTQMQMNSCANEEAARADSQLNDVYRKVLAQAASEPEGVAKIKAAERAWIAYRDAYIDAMYPAKDKQAEYGSIYPIEVNLLRAKLIREQVIALEELLKQYSGNNSRDIPARKKMARERMAFASTDRPVAWKNGFALFYKAN